MSNEQNLSTALNSPLDIPISFNTHCQGTKSIVASTEAKRRYAKRIVRKAKYFSRKGFAINTVTFIGRDLARRESTHFSAVICYLVSVIARGMRLTPRYTCTI